MVKAAPASSLIMTQSEFLLQLFVVALDDRAMLRHPYQIGKLGDLGRVESQYLVGSASWLGHSISSHCSARGSLL